MIHVYRPYLPPIETFHRYVSEIYDSHWVTNDGPLLKRLEARLCERLGVPHVVLVGNGTLAIQLAARALGCAGHGVTTPFTYVATASALQWEGLDVSFGDVDETNWGLSATAVRGAADQHPSVVVPVHVYGIPCDVDGIERAAAEQGARVIYDAAHCFDVSYRGKSLLLHGDASTLSFQATKVFQTAEGGAVVTADAALADEIRQMVNFGQDANRQVCRLGINAKMNELEAAMGLAVLDHYDEMIEQRALVWQRYADRLRGVVQLPPWNEEATRNFSYFPILMADQAQLERTQARLVDQGVMPRRYFHPLLSDMGVFRAPPSAQFPVARQLSERVLCLPVYPGLETTWVDRICEVVAACVDAEPGAGQP